MKPLRIKIQDEANLKKVPIKHQVETISKFYFENHEYDVDGCDVEALLKNNPEYTIKRKVSSMEDAFKDICMRISQYILDNDSKKMIFTPYIENNYISIYVRKNYINERVEIARIEILNEGDTRKKYGTNLINYIHLIESEFSTTVIENVYNPYLREWCKRNNWKVLDETISIPSYFKSK